MAKKAEEKFDGPYPVTDEAPARDDQEAHVVGDASHEDSPVRTSRPDRPIAASMAGGVGEHKPVESDEYDADGRFRGVNRADQRETR